MKPTPENAKILSLEGLRGIMAWWVVLGHISLTFNWDLPLIDRNSLAVDVFILLSGFVIARLIDKKEEPYGPYILRRGFRLFPLYLVVLAISIVLLQIQLFTWQNMPIPSPKNDYRIILAQESIRNLGEHLLINIPLAQGLVPHSILPHSPYSIVPQAWSISLEWQFYILAPVFMWWTRARLDSLAALITVAVLLMAAEVMPGGFLGDKIAHFGLGITSYLAFDRPLERRKWLCAATLFAVLAFARGGPSQVVPLGLWMAVLWSAAAPSHHPRHAFARLLGSTIPAHLGQISYSVYLVHMVPLYCSGYLLLKIGASPGLIQAGVLGATMVVSYFLALFTYRFIERPGIDLGARFTRSLHSKTHLARAGA